MLKMDEAVERVNARLEATGRTGTADPVTADVIAPVLAGTMLTVEDVAPYVRSMLGEVLDLTDVDEDVEVMRARFHGALLHALLVGVELGEEGERERRAMGDGLPPEGRIAFIELAHERVIKRGHRTLSVVDIQPLAEEVINSQVRVMELTRNATRERLRGEGGPSDDAAVLAKQMLTVIASTYSLGLEIALEMLAMDREARSADA